jgi:hypothetical protein
MVKDPVTGTINSNAKQKAKPVQRKVAKVSRPNTFLDLRPLDNFKSKFVGKKRLSVLVLLGSRLMDSLIRIRGKFGVEVCLFDFADCSQRFRVS